MEHNNSILNSFKMLAVTTLKTQRLYIYAVTLREPLRWLEHRISVFGFSGNEVLLTENTQLLIMTEFHSAIDKYNR